MSQSTLTSQPFEIPEADQGPVLRYRWPLTFLLVAFAIVVCRDAWMDIARIVAKDEEASHIYLVPLVFARLLWVRRHELKDVQLNPSMWGVLITLAGVAFWLTGYIKAMQVVWHFGAILTAVGAFVCVNGLTIVRRLWPAFLVLLFLMPLPGVIRHPLALFLQNVSAKLTEVVIVAMGFELTRFGNLLVINDYTVGVAEACNGMRMVSMLILIVFAFVFSEKIRPWVQVFLVFCAIPIAILCNIFRLVPTVLAYGYFSPGFADQLHDWLGWGLAIGSYFVLMGMLWLMRWLLLPVNLDGHRSRRRVMPKKSWRLLGEGGSRKSLQTIVAVVGVVAVLSVSLAVGMALPDGSDANVYHERVRVAAEDLPRQVGEWKSIDTEIPEAAVVLLRPNVLISRRYENDQTGQSFAMLLVQCADARDMEGHYPPNCYPGAGWVALDRQQTTLDIGSLRGQTVAYRFERVSNDTAERISVINLILVPGEGFVTSMSSIRRLAGTVKDRYHGAAQLQFVFSSQWSTPDRFAVVEQFGAELEPLLRVILDKSDEAENERVAP